MISERRWHPKRRDRSSTVDKKFVEKIRSILHHLVGSFLRFAPSAATPNVCALRRARRANLPDNSQICSGPMGRSTPSQKLLTFHVVRHRGVIVAFENASTQFRSRDRNTGQRVRSTRYKTSRDFDSKLANCFHPFSHARVHEGGSDMPRKHPKKPQNHGSSFRVNLRKN